MRFILFMAIICLFLFSNCGEKLRYPDLSTSHIDSLKETDIPGLFLVGSKIEQPRPALPTPLCPKSCASRKTYWVQVTYPITICTAPDFPIEVYKDRAGAKDSSLVQIASSTPVTTLVRKNRYDGLGTLYCKTKGGPWIAEIIDEEMCDNSCGEGSHRFLMTILGVPEDLSWVWWDSMDNHPQDVTFIGQPWLKNETIKDCDPSDLTGCN